MMNVNNKIKLIKSYLFVEITKDQERELKEVVIGLTDDEFVSEVEKLKKDIIIDKKTRNSDKNLKYFKL